MSEEAEETPKISLFERVLAYVAVAIMAIAVASYLTTLIVGMAAGPDALAGELWPFVVAVSYIGLPIGFVLIVVLLIISYVRRGRRHTR